MNAQTIVGICEEVINNGVGKGSGVRIAGSKYGVYDPADAGLDEVSVGTTIALNFTEKNAGGGIIYKNVKGRLTTVKDGTPVTAPSAALPTTGGASKGGFRKNGEKGGFPLHARCYERALDRRNALNAAVKMGTLGSNSLSVGAIIDIAREFEEYTTGDDIVAAEDTINQGLSPDELLAKLTESNE